MSLLADPRLPVRGFNYHWLFLAIAASFSLHLLAVVVYMWTPSYDFAPLPQAAPIAVSIVAPLATSKNKLDAENVGQEQHEVIQKAAHKPIIEPVIETPAKPVVPVVESPKPAPIVLPAKPNKKLIDKKPAVKPQPKPKTVTKDVEPSAEQKQIIQKAQAQPKLKTSNIANQQSALRQGQLSEQGKAANVSWKQALHAHLEREKRYPRKAKRLKKQGMPVIRFTMNRQGKVLNVVLVKSSGTSSLDKEAVDLVYRAQPLIKPPNTISGDQIKLTLPINFSF